MGKLGVYCLKTLNKLSIYPLGNTPSAPSDTHNLHPIFSQEQLATSLRASFLHDPIPCAPADPNQRRIQCTACNIPLALQSHTIGSGLHKCIYPLLESRSCPLSCCCYKGDRRSYSIIMCYIYCERAYTTNEMK